MTEIVSLMKFVERIDSKLDDIRDKLTELEVGMNGTIIRQASQEQEIKALKAEVAELKSSYDKASGAWKLLTLPGIFSLVYAIVQIVKT